MNICDLCKSIRLEDLSHEEEPGIPHQPDLEDLEDSAEDCPLCRAIFLAINELATIVRNDRTDEGRNPYGEVRYIYSEDAGCHKYRQYSGYYSLDDNSVHSGPSEYTWPVYTDPFSVFEDFETLRPYLFGNWWTPATGEREQLIGLGVRVGTGPRPEEAVGNTEKLVHLRGSSFRFRTGHGKRSEILLMLFPKPSTDDGRIEASPLASMIPGRVRSTDASCRIAVDRARGWLRKCDESHCCAQQNAVLPTRLLDIGESAKSAVVKLLESVEGQNGRYIALSHCWGSSHRIKTTNATIDAHKQGISLTSSPEDFSGCHLLRSPVRHPLGLD